MSDVDDRILHAHLEEQHEMYVELCVKALDEFCASGQHDPEPEDYEGEQVLVCSWCSLPL